VSIRLRPWPAVALAGGLAALLLGAVVVLQERRSGPAAGEQAPEDLWGGAAAAPRLLVVRGATGRQQLVSVDLRTGARRTVRLAELQPGRRRLGSCSRSPAGVRPDHEVVVTA
jgi:hypothetical protein